MPKFRHKSIAERIGGRITHEAVTVLTRLREQRYLDSTMRRVRPYSMTSDGRLLELARDVHHILMDGIPGAFVECGVWRGGHRS